MHVTFSVQSSGASEGPGAYCAAQILNGVAILAAAPFGGVPAGVITTSVETIASLSSGAVISAAVLAQTAPQTIIGNQVGGAPHNGVQYNIVRIA